MKRIFPLVLVMTVTGAICLCQQVAPIGVTQAGIAQFTYLRQAQIVPGLRASMQAIGNRLEVPGSERTIMTGTLSYSGASPFTAQMITQNFTELWMNGQVSGAPATVVFNGANTYTSVGQPGTNESNLVSAFITDSAEQMFIGLGSGYAIRHLGDRFRLFTPADSTVAGTCDVYQVSNISKIQGQQIQSTKLYCVDSRTHLLTSVNYKVTQNGSSTVTENRFQNWQLVNGQMLPGKITRLQNSQAVLTFTVTSASVSTAQQDNIFNIPGVN